MFVVRRAGQLVPVLFGVTLLAFLMVHVLPGDVTTTMLGESATPEARAALREQMGFDNPLWKQYLEWLGGAVRGDLGQSFATRMPVTETIMQRFTVTAEIVVLTLALAVAMALPAGLLSARFRGRWPDRASSLVAYAGVATPHFLLALVLILVVCLKLGWLPATGWSPISEGLGANLRTAILPAAAMCMTEYAVYMRILRSDLVDGLTGADYVTTGRAKGLSINAILLKHVLRNSALPFVTIIGIRFGVLMSGAVIIEQIFAVPGVGSLLIEAIHARDIPLVQGVVVFSATVFVFVNFVVDLLYALLDPRVRLDSL